MDVDKFLKASVELYYSAPTFFNYSIPILIGGYVAFLWAGYGFGKWVQQSEIAGLKASNDAAKAQNDALKAQNDIGKERAGVMEERLKLAKEQADDAQGTVKELETEVDDLKSKIEANASSGEISNGLKRVRITTSRAIINSSAVSDTLSPRGLIGGGILIKPRLGPSPYARPPEEQH